VDYPLLSCNPLPRFRLVLVRVAVHQLSPDGMSGCSVDSTPDLSSTDSTGGRAVDAEHQATDLAVGFESLAASIIAFRDARRVLRELGSRLGPGDSLDCVDNGGNDEPATWVGLPRGRSKTGTGAAGSRATR
jgi:hypothetical protein